MGRKEILSAVSLVSGLALIMAGCLKTPEIEYVGNKEGQNTLISDHAAAVGEDSITEQVKAPETAEGECEKVNEYTTIEIKADVAVPEGNAVQVWKTEPMDITSANVKQYVELLYGEDGDTRNRSLDPVFASPRSEEEIYNLLETYTRWLDTAVVTEVAEPVFDEEGNAVEINESCRQEWEETVESLKMELAQVTKDQQAEEPLSFEFAPHSDTFYLEEENYDYDYEAVAFTGKYQGKQYNFAVFKDGCNTGLKFWLDRDVILQNGYSMGEIYGNTSFAETNMSKAEKTNSCQYSKDEAVAMCEEFLSRLGIENMDAGMVQDLHLLNYNDDYLGNKGYRIFCYWNHEDMQEPYMLNDMYIMNNNLYAVGNVLTNQIADDIWNMPDGTREEKGYSLRTLRSLAAFTVLDDGIVEVWIQNPLENREQLAENVSMLDFEQILERGTAFLEASYGDYGTSPLARCDMDITTIELKYARMQAPDSDKEFIMIPVWDFKEGTVIRLTINAIDGSRLDRSAGY